MKLVIPPPIQGLTCAGLIWVTATYFPEFVIDIPFKRFISAVLFLIGIALDLMALRLFSQSETTVSPLNPEKTSAMVTTGVYGYSRNPMYLGMVFLLAGLTVWFGAVAGLPLIVLFVWSVTRFQIKPEEEILLTKFGDAYSDYCAHVRRWI